MKNVPETYVKKLPRRFRNVKKLPRRVREIFLVDDSLNPPPLQS